MFERVTRTQQPPTQIPVSPWFHGSHNVRQSPPLGFSRGKSVTVRWAVSVCVCFYAGGRRAHVHIYVRMAAVVVVDGRGGILYSKVEFPYRTGGTRVNGLFLSRRRCRIRRQFSCRKKKKKLADNIVSVIQSFEIVLVIIYVLLLLLSV